MQDFVLRFSECINILRLRAEVVQSLAFNLFVLNARLPGEVRLFCLSNL